MKHTLLNTSVKLALFLTLLLLNVNFLAAQSSSWNTYQTTSQLKIEYSNPVVCNMGGDNIQGNYSLLRFTNLTGTSINVSYHVDYYYVGPGCSTCTNNEYTFTLTIPANGSVEGSCGMDQNLFRKLSIFKSYANRANQISFDKFELTHITVTMN